MPSPFPGMDPYLEDLTIWPIFQHQFAACLYPILLPALVDRYRARVLERKYTTEQPLFTSIIREEHTEQCIEIRSRKDGRLVTMIDLVSPINKTTTAGREAYLAQRRDARNQGANVVEIDLLLQGQPMLDYSREGLPDWDYAITVTRSSHPERYEIYTTTLQKRLPRFKVPLATDDSDTVLDLQAAFARSYDEANLNALIDYRKKPPVALQPDDLEWLDDWLKKQQLRG